MAHSATSSVELTRWLNTANPAICIVKFGNNATCPPCKASHPVFHHAAEKHQKKCNFVDVDLGAAGSLGGTYGIRSMPTFIYFKNGVEVKRVTGASELDTQIGAFVQQYGKTVFETSQGKSLGSDPTPTTTTATSSSTTTTSSSGTQRSQRNNPWAQKDFNPAAAMRKNAGQDEILKNDDQKDVGQGTNDNDEDTPDGVVCKDGVCYFPSSGTTTTKNSTTTATTTARPTTQGKGLAISDNNNQQRSVCNSCSIM